MLTVAIDSSAFPVIVLVVHFCFWITKTRRRAWPFAHSILYRLSSASLRYPFPPSHDSLPLFPYPFNIIHHSIWRAALYERRSIVGLSPSSPLS